MIPLRPLGLGEILDGAISYVRANPKVTLGVSAIVAAASQLVQLVAMGLFTAGAGNLTGTASNTFGPGQMVALFGGVTSLLVSLLVLFIGSTVLNGLLIAVISRSVIGQRPTFGEIWAATRRRLLGLFGIVLLLTLASIGTFLVAAVPTVLVAVLGSPGWLIAVAAIPSFLGALGAVVYLGVRWSLATPSYILEDVSVFGAMGHSARLVRGQWWRMFGILLLAAVIAQLVSSVLSIPFAIVGVVVATSSAAMSIPGMAISSIGAIVGTAIAAPFYSGVNGLLYFDARMRREGLDIELTQSTQVPPAGPGMSAPGAGAPVPGPT